ESPVLEAKWFNTAFRALFWYWFSDTNVSSKSKMTALTISLILTILYSYTVAEHYGLIVSQERQSILTIVPIRHGLTWKKSNEVAAAVGSRGDTHWSSPAKAWINFNKFHTSLRFETLDSAMPRHGQFSQ